jgi:hypothetical protein
MNTDLKTRTRMPLDASARTFAIIGLLTCGAVAFAHGMPPEDIARLERGGNLAYMWMGARHMLTGYDHLLFLFGVMFFLTRAVDILKFITAFTLGHSITLTFGTFAGIQVNYYLVDAFIALTVIYKAVENMDGFRRWLGFTSPNMLAAVFVFGLVHGLGLAARLQEAPLPSEGLLARILSFNVGVEIGQIAALAVILLLLAAWRKRPSFGLFSQLANKILVAFGVLLFLMQMHGYLHTTQPDDFGFSKDLHDHAHQDIELEEQRSRHTDSLD